MSRLLDQMTLEVAGIRVGFRTDDPALFPRAEGAINQFLCDDHQCDLRIDIGWADLDNAAPGPLVFDSGSLWRASRDEQGFRDLWFRTPFFGDAPYKRLRLNPGLNEGVLEVASRLRGTEIGSSLEYPIDELIWTHLLAAGRGVEMHASGIRDVDGKGWLFVGPSGAGKSTLAQFWVESTGATVLSDDRIAIRRTVDTDGAFSHDETSSPAKVLENWKSSETDAFAIHGTPWHGDARLASPAMAPLGGIYLLRQGSGFGTVRLGASQAVARLSACAFLPWYDAPAVDFSVGFLEQLVASVPCYELTFARTAATVDALQGLAA